MTFASDASPHIDALSDVANAADARVAALTGSLAQVTADAADARSALAVAEQRALDANARAAAAEAARLSLEQRVRDLTAQLAAAGGVPVGWKVAFEDTFDGTAVDTTRWNVRSDYQGNHLGKNEPANATVKDGALALACTRRTTPFVDKNGRSLPYSTAYLDTIGKSVVRHGRWEIRCRLGKAKGGWPAFWLRDAALLGELDVMEAVTDGKGAGKIVFTVHQSTNGDQAKKGFTFTPPAGFDWAGLHDFAVEWDGTTMTWFVDGKAAATTNVTQLPWLATSFGPAGLNIRLNYQAGGSMPNYFGLPMDATSVLPDAFTVDRIRVLTKA